MRKKAKTVTEEQFDFLKMLKQKGVKNSLIAEIVGIKPNSVSHLNQFKTWQDYTAYKKEKNEIFKQGYLKKKMLSDTTNTETPPENVSLNEVKPQDNLDLQIDILDIKDKLDLIIKRLENINIIVEPEVMKNIKKNKRRFIL